MDAFSRLKARLNKGTPASIKESKPSAAAAPITLGGQNSTTSPSPVTQPGVVQPESQIVPRRPPVQSWPVRLESPRYRIQITVYHYLAAQLRNTAGHTFTELYVWTFISTGLQAIAGGELVLVIQRRSNESPESYPMDFLRMCDAVYERASKQHLVLRRWKLIELDEPLFNRPDFKTIALGFRNSPLFGMESVGLDENPIPHFYCLALSDQELAVARKCGVVRTLVSAEAKSWFPFPFYVDRDRKLTLAAFVRDDSVVASNMFNKLEVTGLNVIHADSGQVTLHVPQDRVWEFKAAMLAKRAASITSLLIQADMHDACEGVYLWKPGRSTVVRTMTSQSATNIAANFLLLSFNQPNEAVRLVEDGLLGKTSLARLNAWSCQLTFWRSPFELGQHGPLLPGRLLRPRRNSQTRRRPSSNLLASILGHPGLLQHQRLRRYTVPALRRPGSPTARGLARGGGPHRAPPRAA